MLRVMHVAFATSQDKFLEVLSGKREKKNLACMRRGRDSPGQWPGDVSGTLARQAAFSAERPHPDCTGPDRWPAAMTGVRLKELGFSEKAGDYDRVEAELLASEPLPAERQGRPLFRQVHKVTITDGGRIFTAITISTASFGECSESGVDVSFVSIECSAGDDCRRRRLPGR